MGENQSLLLNKFRNEILKNMSNPGFKPIDAAADDSKELESIHHPKAVLARPERRMARSDAVVEESPIVDAEGVMPAPPPLPPPTTRAVAAAAVAPVEIGVAK